MITNPAWFALLPVILLASPSSVSAKERIVPAVSEPVQAIPANTALHPGKATSGYLQFNEFGRASSRQGISDDKRDPIQIDREKS